MATLVRPKRAPAMVVGSRSSRRDLRRVRRLGSTRRAATLDEIRETAAVLVELALDQSATSFARVVSCLHAGHFHPC